MPPTGPDVLHQLHFSADVVFTSWLLVCKTSVIFALLSSLGVCTVCAVSEALMPLTQSDDEVNVLASEAARPSSPTLARDSPSAQALPRSTSSNSLAAAAGSSPEPPASDGSASSPAVLPLDVAAAARAAGAPSAAAAAADAEDGSDGDSPRYSAHPATMQTIKQNMAAGGGGSPASSPGTNSPSVAAATAAKPGAFKMTATSWLQGGGKGSDGTGVRVGSGDAVLRTSALGRTASNASAEGAGPTSPTSSWGSRAGDTAVGDWHAESVPGPSPLGLGSGRLTAEQAAAAARILMAGGTLPGSPTTQADSPFARAQHADGGHISFSSTSSRGRSASEGPQARMSGRLGQVPAQSSGAQDASSTQPGNAPLAQLEGPGSGSQPQPQPRIRSSTSMSRIAEDAAVASAKPQATTELRPPSQVSTPELQPGSNEEPDGTADQAAVAQSIQHRAASVAAGNEAAESHEYAKHQSLSVNAVTLQL